MGIPCYFVSLLRKYPSLMQKFKPGGSGIDVLYLDSNSIVYDSLREMDVVATDVDASVIEALLLNWMSTLQ